MTCDGGKIQNTFRKGQLLLIGRSRAHMQAGVCLLQTFSHPPLTGTDKLQPSKGDSAGSEAITAFLLLN